MINKKFNYYNSKHQSSSISSRGVSSSGIIRLSSTKVGNFCGRIKIKNSKNVNTFSSSSNEKKSSLNFSTPKISDDSLPKNNLTSSSLNNNFGPISNQNNINITSTVHETTNNVNKISTFFNKNNTILNKNINALNNKNNQSSQNSINFNFYKEKLFTEQKNTKNNTDIEKVTNDNNNINSNINTNNNNINDNSEKIIINNSTNPDINKSNDNINDFSSKKNIIQNLQNQIILILL